MRPPLAAGCLITLAAVASAADGDGRVGWRETFAAPAPWLAAAAKPMPGGSPIAAEAADGRLRLVTPVGGLTDFDKRPQWPEWPKDGVASGFSRIEVDYGVDVDVDRYPYLVAQIPAKSTFSFLTFAGIAVPLLYTTGTRACDLRELGLHGAQRVRIAIQFNNTGGDLVLHELRMVRELDAEERAGLIPAPLALYEEKLPTTPYHGLEALDSRAGRPRRDQRIGGEWCVFRDPDTHAEVWRMTNTAGDECGVSFNADGSAFTVRGRRDAPLAVFDWTTRAFAPIDGGIGDAAPRFSTTDPSSMIVATNQNHGDGSRTLALWRHDIRTGKRAEIASFTTRAPWRVQELVSSPWSERMIFAFRETDEAWIIDPAIADPAKRCSQLKLPTRLKAISFQHEEREIAWFNCYTYQPLGMDLASGKSFQLSQVMAGGHDAHGDGFSIGPYGDRIHLRVASGMHPQTAETADEVRIWARFREQASVDYGTVNAGWLVRDGSGGDLYGQHLMFALDEPSSLLRICRHNTSRNDWATNTYSVTSPDATKLAWYTDEFDDGDVCLAITGRPLAPGGLSAKRTAAGIDLTWKKPASREIAGYRVYRSATSGRGFVALDDAPIVATGFSDAQPPAGAAFYAVAAVEPSGIESAFSSEVAVDAANAPRVIGRLAVDGARTGPAHLAFDGDAAGLRYVRIFHAAAGDAAEGSLALRVDAPDGRYALALRARAERGDGAWTVRAGGKDVASVACRGVERLPFAWIPATGTIEVRGGGVDLVLAGSADGLALDAIALASDVTALPTDHAGCPPFVDAPAPATDVVIASSTPQSAVLRWKPSATGARVRYDIHALPLAQDKARALGNATIIGSTMGAEYEDFGLSPGSAVRYAVVAVEPRGAAAPPAIVAGSAADQPVQTLTASLHDATRDPRLVDVKDSDGETLATLPRQPDGAAPATIAYAFDVTDVAPFVLWARYRPAHGDAFDVAVTLDGAPLGTWRLRAPFSGLDRHTPKLEYTYSDKVVIDGKDAWTLPKGRHVVAFALDPKLGDAQHAFGGCWISNDHAFRPPGYDPQANWHKRFW